MSEISLFSPSSVEWMLIRLKLSLVDDDELNYDLWARCAISKYENWEEKWEEKLKNHHYEWDDIEISREQNCWVFVRILGWDSILFFSGFTGCLGWRWLRRQRISSSKKKKKSKKNHTQISISVVSVCEDFRNLRSAFLSTLIWFIPKWVSTDSERSLMCREMLKLSLSLSEDLSLFEDCCRCRRYLLPFTLPPRQSQSSVALIMTHQVVSGRNRLLFFCLKFPLWLGLNWPATDRSDLDSFARCHKFARLSWSWLEVITYGQSEKY